MRLSVFTAANQQEALRQLAELAQRSTIHPLVQETAKRITMGCESRDDTCELEAIYNAVKYGTAKKALREMREYAYGADQRLAIDPLLYGVRYVSDPRYADHFTAPYRLLKQCARGACAGDCDDHAALIVALAGSLGFAMGLRVWGPDDTEFVHVYAVAGVPKRDPREVVGMDTTVDEASVGWEPPRGNVLTAWLDEREDA